MKLKFLIVVEEFKYREQLKQLHKTATNETSELRICHLGRTCDTTPEIPIDYSYVINPNGYNYAEYISLIGVYINQILKEFLPDKVLIHGSPLFNLAVSIPAYFSGCLIDAIDFPSQKGKQPGRFPGDMAIRLSGLLVDNIIPPSLITSIKTLHIAH